MSAAWNSPEPSPQRPSISPSVAKRNTCVSRALGVAQVNWLVETEQNQPAYVHPPPPAD
jgi:hypothetical protein